MNLPKRWITRITAGALAISAALTPAFAVTGTVDAGSGLRMRNAGDTDAAILDTLDDGTQVEVSGITEDGWYQVRYNDMTGYVSGEYLVVDETEKQSLPMVGEPVYGRVTAGPLNVRSTPSTEGERIKQLSAGTVLQLLQEVDGWYQIEDGYVSGDYVEIIEAAEAVSPSGGTSQVVDYARQYLGYPYVYGGASPKGFDCSGFVKYIYSQFDVKLSRTASAQMNHGVSISSSDLQPGDLVFFKQTSTSKPASHVGIYVGGGQFIHASSPSTGVIISDMDSHTGRGYVGARRVL